MKMLEPPGCVNKTSHDSADGTSTRQPAVLRVPSRQILHDEHGTFGRGRSMVDPYDMVVLAGGQRLGLSAPFGNVDRRKHDVLDRPEFTCQTAATEVDGPELSGSELVQVRELSEVTHG